MFHMAMVIDALRMDGSASRIAAAEESRSKRRPVPSAEGSPQRAGLLPFPVVIEKGQIMKNQFATFCFALGTLLAPVAALAADGDTDRSHPMVYVDDAAITAKVKAGLADEQLSSLANIHVDTDANGAVTLSGTARNQAEIDKAVALARKTEGVTSVKNDIRISNED